MYLKDLSHTNEEILDFVKNIITKEMFLDNYENLDTSNKRWNELKIENTDIFNWSNKSTYINFPLFF